MYVAVSLAQHERATSSPRWCNVLRDACAFGEPWSPGPFRSIVVHATLEAASGQIGR